MTMLVSQSPYSWGQYVKTLLLLIGFGWVSGVIVLTSIFLINAPILIAGLPAAASVALIFLSIPLWVFMRWSISRWRALLAGFVTSVTLILVLSNESIWPDPYSFFSTYLFWELLRDEPILGTVFVLLCTLSAGAIHHIIGPGEPPNREEASDLPAAQGNPERAYGRAQYVTALVLLIVFGFLAGATVAFLDEPRALRYVLHDPIRRLTWVVMIGAAFASLVGILFFAFPLWLFMRRSISLTRALLAGLVASVLLVAVLYFIIFLRDGPSVFDLFSFQGAMLTGLFMLLCTLSAGIIRLIIGPSAAPQRGR